jgi:hypothetical protein
MIAALFLLPIVTSDLKVVPLPGERHGHRIERVGNHLVVLGGFDERSDDSNDRGMRDVWTLDMETGVWKQRRPMFTARAFFGSAVVDGRVAAFGPNIEWLSKDFDGWGISAAPFQLKSHFGAAALGDKIYVVGGFPTEEALKRMISEWRFQIVRPPDFVAGDHFQIVVSLAGRIHVIGGLDGKSFSPRRSHWTLEREGWRPAPPPPRATWAKFAAWAVDGDKLWLFDENAGYCYDHAARRWAKKAKMPFTVAMGQAVIVDRRLYVLGGLAEPRKNVLLCYDLKTDKWRDLSPSPARSDEAASVRPKARQGRAYAAPSDTNRPSSCNHSTVCWHGHARSSRG